MNPVQNCFPSLHDEMDRRHQQWAEWLENSDYSTPTPQAPPTLYWPPPMPYDPLQGSKPAPLSVPLLQPSYRRMCHPYARYQTLPFLGYPMSNPFLSGYPYDRMLTMSYRQTPFMRLGKPDVMLNSTIKPEQHLPDNIAEIILELETEQPDKTTEPNLPPDGISIPTEEELHKLSSQDNLLDERSELELLELDLDSNEPKPAIKPGGEVTHSDTVASEDMAEESLNDSGISDSFFEVGESISGEHDEQEEALILFKTKLELVEQKPSNRRLKTKLISFPSLPLNQRRSLNCEFCGKEYQSMSGLKYHREKAQTRCNPDFV